MREGFYLSILDVVEEPKVTTTHLPHKDYVDSSWLSNKYRSLSNFINFRIKSKARINPF